MAENFAGAVNTAVDAILAPGKGCSTTPSGAAVAAPKAAKPVERYVPNSQLPQSIQRNREPYVQGEWRKEPYIPRCDLALTGLATSQMSPSGVCNCSHVRQLAQNIQYFAYIGLGESLYPLL
jgi:hypothetical protein